MAATLEQILLAPGAWPSVIADCQSLIAQEIADKSGVSGTAVKVAYKTVTSFAPGYYRERLEEYLPEIAARLEPFWADFHTSGGGGFGDYLAKRGGEVADALLSVTDAAAGNAQRPVIAKAYRSVRGGAARHVEAALPRVGDLVVKYAA